MAEFVEPPLRRPAGDARGCADNGFLDPDAVGNDYGFERIFARQIEALGQAGDVFMGISTSGNSPNVLRALELCEKDGHYDHRIERQATGGKMAPLCDYCIRIPSDVTMYIQQAHLALEHIFCMMVERHYFGRISSIQPAPQP